MMTAIRSYVRQSRHVFYRLQTDTRIHTAMRILAQLLTGRTHQIRAQMADAGWPLLGDGKYGKLNKRLLEKNNRVLMISVCATRVMADICCDGGMIDLVYAIELEQSAAGTIDYHLDIRPKY